MSESQDRKTPFTSREISPGTADTSQAPQFSATSLGHSPTQTRRYQLHDSAAAQCNSPRPNSLVAACRVLGACGAIHPSAEFAEKSAWIRV